jgi:hypothetical protein
MKKSRLMLGCLAIVATLTLAVGCMWPDYQLDYTVTTTNPTTNSVQVNYSIYNASYNSLSNVMVKINIDAWTVANNHYTTTVWTPAYSLSSGSTAYGSMVVSLQNYGSVYNEFTVEVISTAWDVD